MPGAPGRDVSENALEHRSIMIVSLRVLQALEKGFANYSSYDAGRQLPQSGI